MWPISAVPLDDPFWHIYPTIHFTASQQLIWWLNLVWQQGDITRWLIGQQEESRERPLTTEGTIYLQYTLSLKQSWIFFYNVSQLRLLADWSCEFGIWRIKWRKAEFHHTEKAGGWESQKSLGYIRMVYMYNMLIQKGRLKTKFFLFRYMLSFFFIYILYVVSRDNILRIRFCWINFVHKGYLLHSILPFFSLLTSNIGRKLDLTLIPNQTVSCLYLSMRLRN